MGPSGPGGGLDPEGGGLSEGEALVLENERFREADVDPAAELAGGVDLGTGVEPYCRGRSFTSKVTASPRIARESRNRAETLR